MKSEPVLIDHHTADRRSAQIFGLVLTVRLVFVLTLTITLNKTLCQPYPTGGHFEASMRCPLYPQKRTFGRWVAMFR